MRTILNIIWFLFAGIELFIAYVFFGVIACIFIVTIPAGVACFRMASYVVWPFGREVVDKPGAGAGSALMNVVWFLVAGLWLAIGHIMTSAACFVTLIGIPFGIQHVKLAGIALAPIGKTIVSKELAAAVRGEMAQQELARQRR